jgi:hypothetical protein
MVPCDKGAKSGPSGVFQRQYGGPAGGSGNCACACEVRSKGIRYHTKCPGSGFVLSGEARFDWSI